MRITNAADSTDLFTITNAGDVGIGTSSPNNFSNYKVLTIQGGTSGSGIDLELSSGDIHGRFFGDTNGVQIQSTQAGDSIRFETAGANERMRIDASGRVGLGTTSPTKPSSSNANTRFMEIYSADGADLILGNSATSVSVGDHIGALAFKNVDSNPDSGVPHYAGIRCEAGNTSGSMDLRFYVGRNNLEADATNMIISSAGSVGIGTSSPDQTLHVHKGSAGSISSTGNSVLTLENSNDSILQFLSPSSNVNQIRFGDPADNGAGYIDYNHGNNALTFGTNGPEKMRLDSNGRLGIGETAPLAQLHIKPPSNMSQLLLEQNNAVDGYALFQDGPNGGHLKFMRHVNGSETQTLLLRAGGGLCFGTDNAAANALNDYEEGTFTGGFNDFNGTYTANTGTYTKIGNVVTIQIMVSGNGGSGSGALILTSLPFASEGTPSTYRAVGAIHAHTGLVTGGIQIVGLMNNNENKVRIRTVQNNATTTDLNRNGLNSGGWEVVIGITYHTAA